MLAAASRRASDAANGAKKSNARSFGDGIGRIATGGTRKAKKRVNTLIHQLFGIGCRFGGVVAVVQGFNLDFVACRAVLGVDGIKKHFGAIEIGQTNLVSRTG